MSQVLVTGASGFVGQQLCSVLNTSGYKVRAAVRRSGQLEGLDFVDQVVIDDIGQSTRWGQALVGIDYVIHLAARVHVMNESTADPLAEFRKVNLQGTMALAQQAAQAGVKRFIYISSVKVNGEETKPGKPFTADDNPEPLDPYGVSKSEAEQELFALAASTNLEVVIIRPVLVYGPGVKANFRSLMKWVDIGIPLPLGLIHNKRSLVALDNLVDLIIVCIDHADAVNQIFLVSDGEDLSTTELLQRVGKALKKPARLISVPVGLINFVAALIGKRDVSQRLLGSLQVDITKTRETLSWSPPVSVDEAFKKTAQSFLKNK